MEVPHKVGLDGKGRENPQSKIPKTGRKKQARKLDTGNRSVQADSGKQSRSDKETLQTHNVNTQNN